MQGVQPAAKVRPTSQEVRRLRGRLRFDVDAALLIEPAQAKHPGNVQSKDNQNHPADVPQVIGVPLNCPAHQADQSPKQDEDGRKAEHEEGRMGDGAHCRLGILFSDTLVPAKCPM